jgi:O-antigen/teichoic acid export membrane protein
MMKNALTTIIANAWSGLVSILVMTAVIRTLGIADYGIIAITPTVQAIFKIWDLGLPSLAIRHIAWTRRDNRDNVPIADINCLSVTVFISSVCAFSAVACLMFFLKPLFQQLNTSTIKVNQIQALLILLIAACNLNASLYQSVMVGLEQHVKLSILRIAESTSFMFATLIIIWIGSSHPTDFLIIQLVVAAGYLILYRISCASTTQQPAYRLSRRTLSLLKEYRFLAGVTLTTIIATTVLQADRVILLALVDKAEFARYSTAALVVGGIYGIVAAGLFSVLYPRVSVSSLNPTYFHKLMSDAHIVMIAASTALLTTTVLLSDWGAYLIVGNAAEARCMSTDMKILACGHSLNLLMIPSYAAMIAVNRNMVIAMYTFAIAVMYIPCELLAASAYGVAGASVVFALMNACGLMCWLVIIHRMNKSFPPPALFCLPSGGVLLTSLSVMTIAMATSRLIESPIALAAVAVASAVFVIVLNFIVAQRSLASINQCPGLTGTQKHLNKIGEI